MLEMVKTNAFPKFALDVQSVYEVLKDKKDDFSKSVFDYLSNAECEIFDALEKAKISRDFTTWCKSDTATALKHRYAELVAAVDETCPCIVKASLDEVYFLLARSIAFYQED